MYGYEEEMYISFLADYDDELDDELTHKLENVLRKAGMGKIYYDYHNAEFLFTPMDQPAPFGSCWHYINTWDGMDMTELLGQIDTAAPSEYENPYYVD